MAGISAIQRILDNQLTSKFARSLKHSDLPEGWAENPEIVALAEDAYREMGTESPFFKAYFQKSKVVDEDGLPMPVYHGSTEKFDVFDPTKSRANMDIQGSFFSPWEIDAGGYGPNIHEVFLSLQNPASSSKGYKALKAHQGENYAGVSAREDLKKAGYDGVDNDAEEFIAFAPAQIKSTSNRGTFNPADPNIYKGLIPAIGAGGMLALLDADEAEAAPAVYGKDGRRLLGLLDKAADGTLTPDEPPLAYPAKMPDGLLKSYQADDPRFVSDDLGSTEGDVFHYWKDHHGHMTNEQIEDAMWAVLYGDNRFHTKGNLPYPEGLGSIHEGKGYNASLYPGEQFTGIYQLNPINEKRLLKKMKSLEMGTPDESAGHPIVARPEGRDVRSERVSADGVHDEANIPHFSAASKAMIPLVAGGAVLTPDEAQGTAYQFPADRRGTVLYEPGLESPIVDPADLLTAPIGVPTAALKAASVAAEPFVSYGMDKLIGGILSLFDEEE